jgi:tousled-like kinase
MLDNQEKRLRDKLHYLEKEKVLYMQEYKRIRDEEGSKYCGIQSKGKYTELKDRYLILSILGKGGYSEVYKGFDLEMCREVAIKIHHFDNNWSEHIKDNYIKHATRENEIHKELIHRRIVRQFDTVEIDHNSFATIQELCSGPDLYYYLKQNG